MEEGHTRSLPNCFLQWLRAVGQDLLQEIAVVRRRHRVDITLRRFPHTLSGSVHHNMISVAAVKGQVCFDYVFHADALPERTSAGWVCSDCEEPQVFRSRDDLYRDHLFEPFRAWVLGPLAASGCVEFWSVVEGATMAKLRSEPEVPPKLVQQHDLNTRRRAHLEQSGASRDELYAFDRRAAAEIEQLWRENVA